MDYTKFTSFCVLLIFSTRAEFIFRIHEEVPNGTVVASGLALAALNVDPSSSNSDGVPIVVNRNAPGAANFAFVRRRKTTHSGSSSGDFAQLDLIVSGRVDREAICPPTRTGDQQHYTNDQLFHIDDPSSQLQQIQGGYQSRFRYSSSSSTVSSNVDCLVALRVASGDKIFHVKIEILDINDNSPSWAMSEYQVFLRDGDPAGTSIALPLAEDADSSMNGELTYILKIDDNGYQGAKDDFQRHSLVNWFELVKDPEGISQKLMLRTKTVIDREQSPEVIHLILVARDAASPTPKIGKLRITINITDVNDNPPMFERPVYKVDMLFEDTPIGKKLLQLQAQDMDVGANSELFYRFEDTGQPIMELVKYFFELTPDGQLKVRNRLNVDHNVDGQKRLPSTLISFGVEAVDGAEAAYALTGHTTIQLQVSDTNDESPRIQVNPIRPPTTVDIDRRGTAIETSAQENGNTEQLLAHVEVSDPDLDGLDSVECHLKSSSGPDVFQLSSQSNTKGEYSLMTNAQLDRENTPRLEVSILCRDSADHVTRQDVGVNLIDVNDNPPQFEKPAYEFFVVEDDVETNVPVELKKRLLRNTTGESWVRARDKDAGANANITYKIESDPSEQASASYFAIDPVMGTLYATTPLDRESRRWHRFVVVAMDQGVGGVSLSSSAEVLVHVEDLNDNPPQFDERGGGTGGYSFSISENLAPGASIGRVNAIDRDDDQSDSTPPRLLPKYAGNPLPPQLPEKTPSKLFYSMGVEKDAGFFRIDKNTGELTTRRRLDREAQSSYSFQVLVNDGATSSASSPQETLAKQTMGGWGGEKKRRVHTTSASVVVAVIDENDNSPTFVQPNATNHLILLDPATIPGRSLLEIRATDPDEGENGRITYSIFDGNSDGIFNVDPVAGLLYLQGQIPRNTIERANRAVYSPPTSSSSFGMAPSTVASSDGLGGDDGGGKPNKLHHHPTYVLGIEACDCGVPRKLCSRFPNLQIQLRVPSEYNSLGGYGGGYPEGYLGMEERLGGAGSEGWLTSSGSGGRNSLVEQVIIGMTVFFAVVVLIGLLVVFLMRSSNRGGGGGGDENGSCCRLFFYPVGSAKHRDKVAKKIKQTPLRGGPEVEMMNQARALNPLRVNEYNSAGSNRVFITEPMWSETGTMVDVNNGGGGGAVMFDGRRVPRGNPAFSPIPFSCPSTMVEAGSMYQTGTGSQVMTTAFQQPTIGYGMLGPTSIMNNNNNSRPLITNAPFQSVGHRPDEYQTLDPAVTLATNYGLPMDRETYYQSNRHLNNEHRNQQSQNQPQMEWNTREYNRANPTTIQSEVNEMGGSVGSLEYIKTPFDANVGCVADDAFPEPPKIANSTSTLGRSRTLNFPKATFV